MKLTAHLKNRVRAKAERSHPGIPALLDLNKGFNEWVETVRVANLPAPDAELERIVIAVRQLLHPVRPNHPDVLPRGASMQIDFGTVKTWVHFCRDYTANPLIALNAKDVRFLPLAPAMVGPMQHKTYDHIISLRTPLVKDIKEFGESVAKRLDKHTTLAAALKAHPELEPWVPADAS